MFMPLYFFYTMLQKSQHDQNSSKGGPAFIAIAKDRNGFRRLKEKEHIYNTLPQIFYILLRDLVMIFQSLVMVLPQFFDSARP